MERERAYYTYATPLRHTERGIHVESCLFDLTLISLNASKCSVTFPYAMKIKLADQSTHLVYINDFLASFSTMNMRTNLYEIRCVESFD